MRPKFKVTDTSSDIYEKLVYIMFTFYHEDKLHSVVVSAPEDPWVPPTVMRTSYLSKEES